MAFADGIYKRLRVWFLPKIHIYLQHGAFYLYVLRPNSERNNSIVSRFAVLIERFMKIGPKRTWNRNTTQQSGYQEIDEYKFVNGRCACISRTPSVFPLTHYLRCKRSKSKSILFLRYQRIHSKQLHIMLCSVFFVLASTIVCISFHSFSSDSCVWCRNSNKFYALLLTALALRARRMRFSVACMHCSRPLFTKWIWNIRPEHNRFDQMHLPIVVADSHSYHNIVVLSIYLIIYFPVYYSVQSEIWHIKSGFDLSFSQYIFCKLI